ncbi:MAG TPA: ABC transporter permease [Dehalococcoidia bacterium]|jgi:tungstate transport system permease protein|nr:tungstate transporter permease [Chloroflexota bacterium]MDP5876371.1 ABC transporter permease [Dehalococcoidia bacterium]MDP7161487.1 ABC transporter permease [Dehalococcoidia bacterium]MDP7212529.1 ABC transporter permease [Dehalococcoidia bacterium]MDP7514294.1 ABC transporter permease [Dehalococcoidia bacterium]|tara:strand:- start:377 stop:1075 length:699 start_codon:yes stop_codon:yes gene_type:complete
MDLIWDGITEAVRLIFSGDKEVAEIVFLTLRVSGAATVLATVIGVPLGAVLGVWQFRGRGLLISIVNTGMGAPPVVVGLVVMIMLWRSGVLGGLNILYTPWAMVFAQALIALPIVIGFSMAAIAGIDPAFRQQMLALGASKSQALYVMVLEARLAILAAVMAGFGAVISEVGAVMMVGGNIKGETRVLTTATVLESSRGEFGTAIALGAILLMLAFVVIATLTIVQQRARIR